MVPGTAAATIHQQMVYRVQNHSYDLCIPGSSTSEALMLTIDSDASHTAKYVPRQLTRAELVQLLPEVWVTSYEKLQEQANTESLQQTNPTYLRRADKQIEMRFNNKTSSSSPERNPFQTELNMMQEICRLPTDPILRNEPMAILYFDKYGTPVYQGKDETGHIWYDTCYCDACEELAYENALDPKELKKYRKKKAGKPLTSQEILQERYEAGDTTVDLLGEPSGKFEYYVTYGDEPSPTPPPEIPSCQPPPPPAKPEPPKPTPQRLSPYTQKALKALGRPYRQYQPVSPPTSTQQPKPDPISCYLMSQEPSDHNFPPPKDFDNLSTQTSHKWKIPNPTSIGSDGQVKKLTAAEAALNWQAENALAQNKVLTQIAQQTKQINSRVSSISTMEEAIADLKMRILVLNDQMRAVSSQVKDFAATANFFRDKENEKKALQTQLESLERSEYAMQQQQQQQAASYMTQQKSMYPKQDFPDSSLFYPSPTPPTSPYDLCDYTLSGKSTPTSINLWDEPPKRRLPPWSNSPLKPKPKFIPPKSNYPYKAKHPSQIDTTKPIQRVSAPPTAREVRGIVLKEPESTPLQHIPPQPTQISAKTSPTSQPSAYTSRTDTGDIIQGASTKPMDMFTMEAFENHSANQIGSFLKALALSDREPVKTNSENLFGSFDQLFSAQPSNSQPPPATPTEPMVEDPPEPINVPLNQPPPQPNHAHDNHIATSDPEIQYAHADLYGVPSSYNFVTFLKWFKSVEQWKTALQTHHHTYCLIHFHKPLRVPHPDGSNATIEAWFTKNLAKSIKEPYNLNYVTFLRNICALNRVDYDSVPDYVKFDHDPWQKAPWEVCGPLFECLYSYAISHRWDFSELSSDSEAFVGIESDEEDDNIGHFGDELAKLANTSNDEDGGTHESHGDKETTGSGTK
ncbi:hypothetical protein LguiB_005485 [Lonicera macranthoides]